MPTRAPASPTSRSTRTSRTTAQRDPAAAASTPAAAAASTRVSQTASAKPARATKAPRTADKAPKLYRKPVRERVKLPEADVALIDTLKARAAAGGRPARKSELVRAGLQALSAMDTPSLVLALKDLEPLKLARIRPLE